MVVDSNSGGRRSSAVPSLPVDKKKKETEGAGKQLTVSVVRG